MIRALLATPRASDGAIQIAFNGLPFVTHRVQYTERLTGASWTNAAALNADALGALRFVDTNAPALPQSFYRAVYP